LARRFKFTIAFLLKSQNFKFIRRVKRGRDCFFYNVLSLFLTQKSPAPRNLTPKNPVNFKHASVTFTTSLFRTKKAKFIDLFSNKKFKRL
jgi:hypothetical protein